MPTLDWIGKNKVLNHHSEVPFRVLEKQYTYKDGEIDNSFDSENKIIHGDNLEALKSLLPEYEGKIKCIYIDPPYNTGEEHWIYNDNMNDPRIKAWLGETVGKEGEDLTRHDKWLCMMYPRLKLLQRLLSDDGAIFISIDDNEQANLKLMCDEIFGQQNFVSNISWQRTYSTRNDSKGISNEVEHLVVYSKNPNWSPLKLPRTEKMNSLYKSPDNDPRTWTSSSVSAPGASTHQGMVYAIQHPFTGELIYPTTGRHWALEQMQMCENLSKWAKYKIEKINDAEKRAEICGIPLNSIKEDVNAIVLDSTLEEAKCNAETVLQKGCWPYFYFTNGGVGGLRRKTYLDDMDGRMPTNFFSFVECGHTDEAKKELIAIFGKAPFDTPKPTRLIERILKIATDKDSIVLDSFAGSGTTAQAVFNLNKEDGGNRKFLLVELCDYADTITAERVKRVIKGYKPELEKEDVLYDKELTVKNLAHISEYLDEAKDVSESSKDSFDSVKTKLDNNHLQVIGKTKASGNIVGTGGDFTFYELGKPLFNGNFLNEEVDISHIRSYIWFTETHTSLSSTVTDDNEYYLGTNNNVGYWFFYEKGKETCLNTAFLNTIKTKSEQYIIYADKCCLSEDFMEKNNIVFKKIPREIQKF